MKIAVATLNRFFKKSRTTAEIAALIERTEIELEQVLSADILDSKIVIAKIIDIFPHPNADRLKLVTVSTGNKKHHVVCGAPNLSVGQRVAYIQPGAVLPDGSAIEKTIIRGQASAGMLASGRELGLSDDHEGLWAPEDGLARLGSSLCDILISRDVLDIKTPANRWDYLSGEGIARELATYDTSDQRFVPVRVGEYDYSKIEYVDVKSREANPRFVSARLKVMNDVKSPAWLVDNLLLNGIATHSIVVDITNYVMLELGQPTHAYDASTLSGPLSVRFSEKDEKITTLDDTVRTLSPSDIVVCDESGPVGLAGIMGSARCQVQPDTTEIILESAIWDKTIVRRTALRQGMRTEASTRYERGLPLPSAPRALCRMIDLMTELCGAEVLDGPFDQLHAWPWRQQLGLQLRQVERTLGVSVKEGPMIHGLQKLGFEVERFSVLRWAQEQVGKPYKWGANWRQDMESAYDCSYLVDRLYSRIGVFVGHTSLGQFHHGRSVDVDQLKPGDNLFIRGKIEHSHVDHYWTTTPQGEKQKITLDKPLEVGHNGLYIGDGKVIHASQTVRKGDEWVKREDSVVMISPVEEFTKDPGYLGARRYVESFNHLYAVVVPWWRPDVRVAADLSEEIGKLVGYDHIPNTLPSMPAMPRSNGTLVESMKLRRQLSAAGLTEVMTYSFISEDAVQASGLDHDLFLPISNPRSPEQAYVRASLLPSHIQLWAAQSPAVRDSIVCFEISTVFESKGLNDQPKEVWKLGLSARGEDALSHIRASLQHLMRLGSVDNLILQDANTSTLIPQRSAKIMIEGKNSGVVGQVANGTLTQLGMKQPMAWCEIDLQAWQAGRRPESLPAIPPYQLVVRDISCEIENSMWWQEIAGQLTSDDLVWSVEYIDTFEDDERRGADRKVITCRLLLDCGKKPSSSQIETSLEKIVINLKQALPQAKLKIV